LAMAEMSAATPQPARPVWSEVVIVRELGRPRTESGDPAAGASSDEESRGSCPSSSYGEGIVHSRAWKACAPPARW
jgi:hypothetical protein